MSYSDDLETGTVTSQPCDKKKLNRPHLTDEAEGLSVGHGLVYFGCVLCVLGLATTAPSSWGPGGGVLAGSDMHKFICAII